MPFKIGFQSPPNDGAGSHGVSAKRISIGDRLWHGWSILTAKLNILSHRPHAGRLFGTALPEAPQGTASDPRG